MHWKKGTSRVVLVIPVLGICLKFARIRLWTAVIETWMWLRIKGGFDVRLACKYLMQPVARRYSIRGLVLRGLYDNMDEARFSWRLSHPVLARTYVSIGFVNVQEAVIPVALPLADHFRRLESVIGYDAIMYSGDTHAFEKKNFGTRHGKAVVLDYASPAMQKVLDEYADRIHNDLNLVSPP